MKSHPNVYDTIGEKYRNHRIPDPRIAEQITAALGNAQTICNIGAGAGSYEPTDRNLVAVEPSQKMIDQRCSPYPVIQATAEELPFADNQFDVAMALLTIHHWTNPMKGLQEMRRVSRKQIVFAFDSNMTDSLWLVRDYLPEIKGLEPQRGISLQAIAEAIACSIVTPVPIPWDCSDGFQAAYWRRPEEYLKPAVRASISSMAQLPERNVSRAMAQLAQDLQTGEWAKRYAEILTVDEMDFGYRLIVTAHW
ncbi:MAG: class I SAM-dependent methyltransferase [Cyanobacteria bacterium P01_F01_bin.150]